VRLQERVGDRCALTFLVLFSSRKKVRKEDDAYWVNTNEYFCLIKRKKFRKECTGWFLSRTC
jgi:hypothetical protein